MTAPMTMPRSTDHTIGQISRLLIGVGHGERSDSWAMTSRRFATTRVSDMDR